MSEEILVGVPHDDGIVGELCFVGSGYVSLPLNGGHFHIIPQSPVSSEPCIEV